MPPLYCRPSWNYSQYATWSVVAGADDANYPVANVVNLDPSNPFKSAGSTITVQAQFTWQAPILIAQFVMHNLAGQAITITNGAGLNMTLTPGPNTRDGFPEFSWIDFRRSPLQVSNVWQFSLTAPNTVHVGEIVLWGEANFLPILWKVKHGPRRLAHRNVTDWGYEHYYDRGIRERFIDGSLIDGDYLQAIWDLENDAHGCVKQWPLILEDEKRDSYWVRFSDDKLDVSRDAPRIARIPFSVHETGLGLAP